MTMMPNKVKKPAPLRNVAAFSTLIQRVIDRPINVEGIGCFYGPSGYGKTKAAIFGANKHRAAYVECGQFTTAKTLMRDILIELGVRAPRGAVPDMVIQEVRIMAADRSRPLIVDEAHYVADKKFVNALGELHRKSGAPMILIGEETLPAKLEAFERVHNCIMEWTPAEPCGEQDFELLLRVTYDGMKLAPDLANAILEETRGNTRRIIMNLEKAVEIAKHGDGEPLTLAKFGGTGAIIASKAPAPRRPTR